MPVLTLDLGRADRPLKFQVELGPDNPIEEIALNFIRAGTYYEPDIAHLLLRALAPGDTVVDIGANIGLFIGLMTGLSGETGRVLAFEPGDNNLPKLRRNIELATGAPVTLITEPLSDAPGEVTFFLNDSDGGGNALWNPQAFPHNHQAPRAVTLRATTLDGEMAKLGGPLPKLVKIDTEGAELKILRGARALLTERKIPYIVAEYNEFGLRQMGATPGDLRAYMAGFGYEMFLLNGNGSLPKLIPARTALRASYIPNVLFSTVEDVVKLWPEEWFEPIYQTASAPPADKPATC